MKVDSCLTCDIKHHKAYPFHPNPLFTQEEQEEERDEQEQETENNRWPYIKRVLPRTLNHTAVLTSLCDLEILHSPK